MKIAFIASECAPFAKTGGLGDVVGALPKALARLGHDVRIVLPLYASIDRQRFGLEPVGSYCVHMGQGEENWIGVRAALLEDTVPVWFIEYERFYGRSGIYGDSDGEYQDNAYRFSLLPKAALQVFKDFDWIPDVVHLHDWASALGALYLKTWDRVLSPLSNTASVLTIHNIGYQGIYQASAFSYIGVGIEHFNSDALESHGRLNLLKAGIHYSDALTTVSPTHAIELLDPAGGMGMAPYLSRRRGDLTGILNGVDYEHWNPATDPLIPANYDRDDMAGKLICKAVLQERFGLEFSPKTPVLGIISRFASQKGFDLLQAALPNVLDAMAVQVAVLGTGEREVEEFFHRLTARYPGRVGSYIGFFQRTVTSH